MLKCGDDPCLGFDDGSIALPDEYDQREDGEKTIMHGAYGLELVCFLIFHPVLHHNIVVA